MLSTHEKQLWDDTERHQAAGTDGSAPPGRHRHRLDGRRVDDLPGLVVAGIWSCIVLVLFGFVVAGLAVGAVTALGALLWRHRPRQRG